MEEDLQAIELQEIYRQADGEGRKKLVEAAAQLLKAQKSLEDKPDDALTNGQSEKRDEEMKQQGSGLFNNEKTG